MSTGATGFIHIYTTDWLDLDVYFGLAMLYSPKINSDMLDLFVGVNLLVAKLLAIFIESKDN